MERQGRQIQLLTVRGLNAPTRGSTHRTPGGSAALPNFGCLYTHRLHERHHVWVPGSDSDCDSGRNTSLDPLPPAQRPVPRACAGNCQRACLAEANSRVTHLCAWKASRGLTRGARRRPRQDVPPAGSQGPRPPSNTHGRVLPPGPWPPLRAVPFWKDATRSSSLVPEPRADRAQPCPSCHWPRMLLHSLGATGPEGVLGGPLVAPTSTKGELSRWLI